MKKSLLLTFTAAMLSNLIVGMGSDEPKSPVSWNLTFGKESVLIPDRVEIKQKWFSYDCQDLMVGAVLTGMLASCIHGEYVYPAIAAASGLAFYAKKCFNRTVRVDLYDGQEWCGAMGYRYGDTLHDKHVAALEKQIATWRKLCHEDPAQAQGTRKKLEIYFPYCVAQRDMQEKKAPEALLDHDADASEQSENN